MHNCKTAHPKKSHRRRNRAMRRTLTPLRFPDGWGSSEPGPVPEGTGVFQLGKLFVPEAKTAVAETPKPPFGGSRANEPRVQLYPAAMLRRLATAVKRPFVRQAPGR